MELFKFRVNHAENIANLFIGYAGSAVVILHHEAVCLVIYPYTEDVCHLFGQ